MRKLKTATSVLSCDKICRRRVTYLNFSVPNPPHSMFFFFFNTDMMRSYSQRDHHLQQSSILPGVSSPVQLMSLVFPPPPSPPPPLPFCSFALPRPEIPGHAAACCGARRSLGLHPSAAHPGRLRAGRALHVHEHGGQPACGLQEAKHRRRRSFQEVGVTNRPAEPKTGISGVLRVRRRSWERAGCLVGGGVRNRDSTRDFTSGDHAGFKT